MFENRQHPVRGRVHRRHKDRGIRAAALHPGAIQTELGRHPDDVARRELTEIMTQVGRLPGAKPITYKSVPQGAATSVLAAAVARADAVGGCYCEDCHVAEVIDAQGFTFAGVLTLCAQSRARPGFVGEKVSRWSASASPEPHCELRLSFQQQVAARPQIQEIRTPPLDQTIAAKNFGATSTTDDVLEGVNLKGKRVLVTGVSAGLGVETARALAAHGADVVGAARDLSKAKAATAACTLANGGGFELVGSTSRRSTAFAFAPTRSSTTASHSTLSSPTPASWLPLWQDRGWVRDPVRHQPSRPFRAGQPHCFDQAGFAASQWSSAGHRYSDVNLNDPDFERTPYDPWAAYGRSKTANILFAVEFDRRHKANGVRATSIPGGIQTELSRHIGDEGMSSSSNASRPRHALRASRTSSSRAFRRARRRRSGRAAAAADEVGGRYCEDCHVAEIEPTPPSAPASSPTRSIPRQPRRYGLIRARKW